MSGYFNLVPATSAGFVVTGASSGGSLAGNVTDRACKTVLNKTFSGTERGKVHAFADEIIETLTGSKGIANSMVAGVPSAAIPLSVPPHDAGLTWASSSTGTINESM